MTTTNTDPSIYQITFDPLLRKDDTIIINNIVMSVYAALRVIYYFLYARNS